MIYSLQCIQSINTLCQWNPSNSMLIILKIQLNMNNKDNDIPSKSVHSIISLLLHYHRCHIAKSWGRRLINCWCTICSNIQISDPLYQSLNIYSPDWHTNFSQNFWTICVTSQAHIWLSHADNFTDFQFSSKSWMFTLFAGRLVLIQLWRLSWLFPNPYH